MLVQHHILRPGTVLPAPTGLFDYVVAGNGVFLPLNHEGTIRAY